MQNPFIESSLNKRDQTFEQPLRPQLLDDFVGQPDIRDRLEVFIGAAKKRNEPLGHCLFCGPPGLGKTTLAHIISKAMGTNLVVTSGPVLEKAADLAGLLTSLQTGDILFIDEIHRLRREVEEYLYPAMEDYALDLVIDSGPSARSVRINLNRFTLVGATTRAGLLTSPMRSRFALTSRLDYYDMASLTNILDRSKKILNIEVSLEGQQEIAKRCRGTPRIANHLLRWVRDYAEMKAGGKVDREVAINALSMLDIDEMGLDDMDKKILTVMIDHYKGGPVGLNTVAVAVGEEAGTIEEVYEPYLIMKGFIKRTARGREVTSLAYDHLGKGLGLFQERS